MCDQVTRNAPSSLGQFRRTSIKHNDSDLKDGAKAISVSKIQYIIRDVQKRVYFSEIIEGTYSINFSEMPVGKLRGEWAMKGSMVKNVNNFIDQIRTLKR
jgi:hypothetical protein